MGTKKGLLIFALIFFTSVGIGYFMLKEDERLPIYQPSDINPELVDAEVRAYTNHRVADFELINQLGDTITQEDFEGKIYVADFFFTRCATLCPVMTKNLTRVQAAYIGEEDVMILSHSVTPEADSSSVLNAYGKKFGAIPKKWMMVTGEKQHIYELARRSYFAVLDEGDGGDQDFIHTENLILVDKDKRLRGYYDGTLVSDVEKLIEDIAILREEYKTD